MYRLLLSIFVLCLFNHVVFGSPNSSIQNVQINKATIYKKKQLDLRNRYFTIKDGVDLTIEDSDILVNISPKNPYFALVQNGKLILKNNHFTVTVSDDIKPNPEKQSKYYLLRLSGGQADIRNNSFTIDKPYVVGLFVTEQTVPTYGLKLITNKVDNFHGGFYLINSHKALVQGNLFRNVSFSNIYNIGNKNAIIGNQILFPGNFDVGNGIDVINSNEVVVKDNLIASDSCLSLYLTNSQNIVIEHNIIADGLTYGIFIQGTRTSLESKYLKFINQKLPAKVNNRNINIHHNILAKNRFGLGAEQVENLTVEDNIFIQEFNDNAVRRFWTDTKTFLVDISHLVWKNNFYKEAYPQDYTRDATTSKKLVTFPESGGVRF